MSGNADGKGTDTAEKKGGGRLALALCLAGGLLIGGGGVAGWFLFLAPAPETAQVAPSPAPEAGGEKKQDIKTSFIRVDRLSAPVVKDERVLSYVLLDLSLEVKSNSDEVLIAQRMPALRDAFLREATRVPIGKPDQPAVIDFDALSERLRRAANHELQKDAILRVLVTQTTRL